MAVLTFEERAKKEKELNEVFEDCTVKDLKVILNSHILLGTLKGLSKEHQKDIHEKEMEVLTKSGKKAMLMTFLFRAIL